MERFICIHGHFYQPPRENPWLEAVEQQDSAYPYHDWNERITEECYAPNATARILEDNKYIVAIVNNYAQISFNFGPTLLSWLEQESPDVYQAILQADIDSQQRFEYGNAIAQAYNHMIMPLANDRDKYTQVLWGIRDFEHRFKRKPLGMWLPETAVDLNVLDVMAELGIKFTVLAPRQAKQFRKMEDSAVWQDASNGQIPPTMPYVQRLASGREITIFFYDGPVSQEIAFSDLLSQGEKLAQRIVQTFPETTEAAQLATIATDGETYGHHHAFGDMALAYALDYVESSNLAKITNYSQFMHLYPPTHEVEIIENTSWSCIHGVERWKSACGCNSGGHGDWNQNWRAPLRSSLDWLRDLIAPLYETKAQEFLNNPWEARNQYINIILDRSDESLEQFFTENTSRQLNTEEKQIVLKLLEMQRHAMLMYTSCGWFFDELTGIETVQVIAYAYRAIQLAENLFSIPIAEQFFEQLSAAKSNIAAYNDPKFIYQHFVKPSIVNWHRIASHYAITSLFENYEKQANIYCYTVHCQDTQQITQGSTKLVVGNAWFESTITKESKQLCFAALHFGDQNITCGVREFGTAEEYTQWLKNLSETFNSGDLVAVTQLFVKYFGDSLYSISSLFRDKQHWVVDNILSSTFEEINIAYQKIYQRNIPLMHFLEELDIPLPEIFKTTAKNVIDNELKTAFKKENFELENIEKLLAEAKLAQIEIDKVSLAYTLQKTLECMMRRFKNKPESLDELQSISQAMKITSKLSFTINLYPIQNIFYQMQRSVYPEVKKRAEQGDEQAKSWVENFATLGAQLTVKV